MSASSPFLCNALERIGLPAHHNEDRGPEWDVRYWKGVYDEDSERDLALRREAGLSVRDDEQQEMWIFRVLVAIQVMLVTLAGLLFVTAR